MIIPQVKRELDGSLTLSVNVKLTGSSLEQEEALCRALNSLGLSGTEAILSSFDKRAKMIEVNGEHLSKKCEKKKSINALMEK